MERPTGEEDTAALRPGCVGCIPFPKNCLVAFGCPIPLTILCMDSRSAVVRPGPVAGRNAVARRVETHGAVPRRRIFMPFESFDYLKYRDEVSRERTFGCRPDFAREVSNLVPDLKTGRELVNAAQTRNAGVRCLKVGFPTTS